MQKYIKIIGWLLVIAYLSLTPSKNIPDLAILAIPYFDKIVHFGIYFVLAILFAALLKKMNYSRYNIYFGVILLSAIVGGGIEILQNILPIDRTGDEVDFIADMTGSLAGMILFFKMKIFRKIDKYL